MSQYIDFFEKKNIICSKTYPKNWIICEFFESIIDKVIKINDRNSNIQLFSQFSGLDYKSRKDFKIIKKQLLKQRKIPRIFSHAFVKQELKRIQSNKKYIKISLSKLKKLNYNLNYSIENNINYLISPLTIGSKILVKFFDESENVFKIKAGQIDAVNYLDHYYRVACTNESNISIQTSDKYIMPLEEHEIIKISEVLNNCDNFNNILLPPLMNNNPSDPIFEHFAQTENQEKINISILITKISILLFNKERMLFELSRLNILAEQEGWVYSDSKYKIARKYADLILSISEINKQIEIVSSQLVSSSSKILTISQNSKGQDFTSSSLYQNLDKLSSIASEKLSKISSPRIKDIIILLLSYFSNILNSKNLNCTVQKEEITSRLFQLLPINHYKYLITFILPEIDNISRTD